MTGDGVSAVMVRSAPVPGRPELIRVDAHDGRRTVRRHPQVAGEVEREARRGVDAAQLDRRCRVRGAQIVGGEPDDLVVGDDRYPQVPEDVESQHLRSRNRRRDAVDDDVRRLRAAGRELRRRIACDLVVGRRAADDPHVAPRVEGEAVGSVGVSGHRRGRRPGGSDRRRGVAEHRRAGRVVAGAEPQHAARVDDPVADRDDRLLAGAHARRRGRHRRLVRVAERRPGRRDVVRPDVLRAGGQRHNAVSGDVVDGGRQVHPASAGRRTGEPDGQRAGGAADGAGSAPATPMPPAPVGLRPPPPPQPAARTRAETVIEANERRRTLGMRQSSSVDGENFS